MRVTVVGGMNLDLLGKPSQALLPRDSAPGHITVRPGGVGRNIAQRLRELGADVSLITALGCDVRAAMLAQFCAEAGIDLSHSVSTRLPAPCYLCVHDEQGDMLYAVNDMAAMDCLTPDHADTWAEHINACDGCVLDANVPKETLLALSERVTVPMLLDPVSCVKAPRILNILPRLFAVKPNRLEAQTLTGESDPILAAEKLLRLGVRNVCITLGGDGVYYAAAHDKGLLPARKLPALPLTGAGDAFCAGLFSALLSGQSIRDSAQSGLDAAYDALIRAYRADLAR